MPDATTLALLDAARDLTVQERFDAEVALKLLERLQLASLDVQSHGAVTHARLVATTALGESSSRTAVARFALARVVTLLEAQAKGHGVASASEHATA